MSESMQMWKADEYVLELSAKPERDVAGKVFDLVWRFDFTGPGFCLLDAGTQVNSRTLRSWMVDLKERLSEIGVRRGGRPFAYRSMASFNQQETTKFHLDGAPDQAMLMLGYESSRVRSRLFLADYRPNGETPTKVNLQTDLTVKMLLGEERPTFRLAIQALRKMDTEEFRLLNNIMNICKRLNAESKTGSRAVDFLMTFASLHSPHTDDSFERDIERLQTSKEVGFPLSFGSMSMILNNGKELEEVGYGSVVAKVQRAAGIGLQAVMDDPNSETLQGLAHDAKQILALKDVIAIPPKLVEFMRQAVEEKKKPRQDRQPEQEVKRPPRATQGKAGTGMRYDSVEAHLRLNGLTPIAGGTKYSYWGLAGTVANEGTFIRLAAKTVRLVERQKDGRKISDFGITEEAYYGKLTPELVDTLIAALKRRSSPG